MTMYTANSYIDDARSNQEITEELKQKYPQFKEFIDDLIESVQEMIDNESNDNY